MEVGVSRTCTTRSDSTPTHSFPVTLPHAVLFVGDVFWGEVEEEDTPTSLQAKVCPLTRVREQRNSRGETQRSIQGLKGETDVSDVEGITVSERVDLMEGFFGDFDGDFVISFCGGGIIGVESAGSAGSST